MDALSKILTGVRVTGAAFLEMKMRERWSYLTAPPRAIAEVLMPEADHVIPYHLVTAGTCFARLPDGEPVELRTGYVIMALAPGAHHGIAYATRSAGVEAGAT